MPRSDASERNGLSDLCEMQIGGDVWYNAVQVFLEIISQRSNRSMVRISKKLNCVVAWVYALKDLLYFTDTVP